MAEDAQLASRICRGDIGAFEELYVKYQRQLYQTAFAITGDRSASEEILQDAFVRAYGAMDKVHCSGSLSPWLHRITVNLTFNWTRGRRWPLSLDAFADRLFSGPTACPEHAAEDDEVHDIVWEAITSLGFNQRAVVVLFYYQGFALPEIAYILDCPTGTIKSRLHRALKALRHRLAEDLRLTVEVALAAS